MTYEDLVRFLVSVRGECWVTANIGVASVHDQWNPLIKEVFEIANDQSRQLTSGARKPSQDSGGLAWE